MREEERMQCESGITGDDYSVITGSLITSIPFADLCDDDNILIETSNSTYRFRVAHGAERRGTLGGGALGRETREAILVSVLDRENAAHKNFSKDLRLNARAIFIIITPDGPKHMITSAITGLGRTARASLNSPCEQREKIM